MGGSGKTALLLLFALNFALYYGGGVNPDGSRVFASGFQEFLNSYVLVNGNSFLNSFLTIITATAVLYAATVLVTGNSPTIVYAQALFAGVLATWFLTPFTILSSVNLPDALSTFIILFFEILILVAVLDFILGRSI